MSYILSIETSGPHCSVCLSDKVKVLAQRIALGVNQHSAVLHNFIEEVLKEAGITKKQLSAIAVSSGPGSYTGLRIGLSTAKGLAYALDIPIIEVSTLRSLAFKMREQIAPEGLNTGGIFIPMIDAGRMEVYYAIFDEELEEIQAPGAGILEASFFENFGFKGRRFFGGNGSTKGVPFSKGSIYNKWIPNIDCSAQNLTAIALEKLERNDVADLAYCLPTYVKKYIPGKSKK